MVRLSKRRDAMHMDTVADYGPSVRRDRDGKLVSTGPASVIMEDRDDISARLNKEARRPVVRGARRWCTLDALEKDGVLDKRQVAAANRFLDDLSRAQGGSQASFLAIVVSGGAGMGVLSDEQRKAIRRIMRVRLMLGLNPDTVTWWVVLDNRTPADFDTHFELMHGTGAKWLKAALTALDEHYNGKARGSA